ncbi:unnamed protein product [Prorocentrum cordatum]|uniref:Uncharacterized protein n=1 Tax=Prorocentrum cordatum TaxID=2364126 RepID=A0ABN9RUH1_9DINO|nr:unnamed protein product [Polarella glacialis]
MGLPGGGGAALLPGGGHRLVEPAVREEFDVGGKGSLPDGGCWCATCGCATWSPWRGQQQQQMCVIGMVLHQWVASAATASEGATSGSLGGAMGAQQGQELLRLLRGAGQPCQDIAHDVDGSGAEQSVAPVDCSVVHLQESVVRNTGGARGARRGPADRRPKAAVGKDVPKTKGDAAAQSQIQEQLVEAVRPIDMERMSGEVGDGWRRMQGRGKRAGRWEAAQELAARSAEARASAEAVRQADAARAAAAGVVQRCWRGWLGRQAAAAARGARAARAAAAPSPPLAAAPAIKTKKGKKAKQGAESDVILTEAIRVAEREAAELASAALKLVKRAVVAALGRLRDGAQQALGRGSSTTLDEQEWGTRFLDGEFAEDRDKAVWVQVVAGAENARGSDSDDSG